MLNGASTITLECHDSFAEPGATATDPEDGNLAVTVSGALDPTTPGLYTLTYTATDSAGASASATRTVEVVDSTPPVISILGENPAIVQCGSTYSDAGATALDACAGDLTFAIGSVSTVNLGVLGTYTVTYTVSDGNFPVSAVRTVTVIDSMPPTITAPLPVVVATGAGLCSATAVTLGTPVTSDNCGVANVSSDAPQTFPKGVTTVTWTVTDMSGNTATATQTVTVKDTEPPTLTGLNNVEATTDSGQCNATSVVLGSPVPADNCGETTMQNDAPATFPKGVTTVTWTVTDTSQNVALFTQTITVTDNEPPTITAPANVAAFTDADGCVAANVVLGIPVTTDNCAGQTVANNAPSTFPKGDTIVTLDRHRHQRQHRHCHADRDRL